MEIDWPYSAATGEPLDGVWFERGTRVPLSIDEKFEVDLALASGGESDNQNPTKAQIREYWRIKSATQRHAMYLAMEPEAQVAATVRGRGYNEWAERVEYMKRTGHLTEALDLTSECVNSALALKELGVHSNGESWLIRLAIILRKLQKHEDEVTIIEASVSARWGYDKLAARLPTARKLLVKTVASETLPA